MKPWRILAVVLGVQALLLGAYWAVDATRTVPTPFVVESLHEAVPPLQPVRDGQPVSAPAGPHLVHFWATWCAPCQAELPALLAASAATGVPVLAVTEEDWPVVERYFEGPVPDAIVQDPSGEADRTWRVSGLPDTFAIAGGRVVGRMGGPRAWQSPEARSWLVQHGRTR